MSRLFLPRANLVKPTNPQLNPTHPLTRKLVAAWFFDNPPEIGSSGTRFSGIQDYSGLYNNLTQFTGFTKANVLGSRHGGAYSFDGTTSFLQPGIDSTITTSKLLNNLPTTGGLSISAWIIQAGGAFGSLIAKHAGSNPLSGWQFGTDASSSVMQFQADFTTDLNLIWTVPANQLFHVTLSWDGGPAGRAAIYINGSQITPSTSAGGTGTYATDVAQQLRVGNSASAEFFNGICESLFVWNRALTPGEANQLYQDMWSMFRPTIAQRAYLYNVIPSTSVTTVVAAPMRMGMGMGT